jgi:hypothetical protein
VAIATISKEGLITIAILVAALWGCWLGYQNYVCQARRDMRGAIRNMQELHRKAHPTRGSVPAPRPSGPMTRAAAI